MIASLSTPCAASSLTIVGMVAWMAATMTKSTLAFLIAVTAAETSAEPAATCCSTYSTPDIVPIWATAPFSRSVPASSLV